MVDNRTRECASGLVVEEGVRIWFGCGGWNVHLVWLTPRSASDGLQLGWGGMR